MMRHLVRLLLLFGAGLLTAAASEHHPIWSSTVAVTPEGYHLLGNPDAKVKLTEYISYTCPHCAHFNRESEATLRYNFVHQGKGAVEIRSYVRNPIDIAASLLVSCGASAHFLTLHDLFLNTQDQWMARFAGISDAQRQRWEQGPMPARMRAIAGDMGFYEMMENNGYDRVAVDRCLGDEAAMKRLAQQTEDADKAGVNGTPGFAINGVVLTGTYDWKMLEPQLQARL